MKVQNGDLNSHRRSIISTVMKARHVFRGGTSIDDDDKERREYYTKIIAECKNEMDAISPPPTTTTRAAKIDLIGRRVVMQADIFGGSEHEVYNGLVVRKERYRQRDKVKHGYVVKWHDGDEDMW